MNTKAAEIDLEIPEIFIEKPVIELEKCELILEPVELEIASYDLSEELEPIELKWPDLQLHLDDTDIFQMLNEDDPD